MRISLKKQPFYFKSGKTLTRHLKLQPLEEGYDYSYDPNIPVSTSNEFAGAAYRLHSMLQVINL